MIAVVLDTNVLTTGLLNRYTPPALLIDAWRAGAFRLVTSEHILKELTRTLTKDYFRQRMTPTEAMGAVALFRDKGVVTPLTTTVSGVATHPEDDLILATVVSGKAAYLVTGDKQLQKLGSFSGATVLSPADFLSRLTIPEEQAA